MKEIVMVKKKKTGKSRKPTQGGAFRKKGTIKGAVGSSITVNGVKTFITANHKAALPVSELKRRRASLDRLIKDRE
jgi:hypothetical protein